MPGSTCWNGGLREQADAAARCSRLRVPQPQGEDVRRAGKKGVCPENRTALNVICITLKQINKLPVFLGEKATGMLSLGFGKQRGAREKVVIASLFLEASADVLESVCSRWNSAASSTSCDTWAAAEGDWSAPAVTELKLCWQEVIHISLLSTFFFFSLGILSCVKMWTKAESSCCLWCFSIKQTCLTSCCLTLFTKVILFLNVAGEKSEALLCLALLLRVL